MGVESWEGGVRWEWGGVDYPAEGDNVADALEVIAAEFFFPDAAKRWRPEEGEPEFFFEVRFTGRC